MCISTVTGVHKEEEEEEEEEEEKRLTAPEVPPILLSTQRDIASSASLALSHGMPSMACSMAEE